MEILHLCAAAGRLDARILIVETILSDPPSADEASFDLFMLTLVGGRQRSLDDFGRLAEQVGLEIRCSTSLGPATRCSSFAQSRRGRSRPAGTHRARCLSFGPVGALWIARVRLGRLAWDDEDWDG